MNGAVVLRRRLLSTPEPFGETWSPMTHPEHNEDEDEALVLCEPDAEMTRLTEVAQTLQLLPQESRDDKASMGMISPAA